MKVKGWLKRMAAPLLLLLVAGGYWAYQAYQDIPNRVGDLYAQWGAAEIIIAYYEDQGALPPNWAALQPYESATRHSSFRDICERIVINFSALPELAKAYPSEDDVPEVITTQSGVQSHWESAEPNALLNAALTKEVASPASVEPRQSSAVVDMAP